MAPIIAPATLADAPQITSIYAHHVLHGTASWEIEPPTPGEIASRMGKALDAGWPWLVARDPSGTILGYAYAAQYNSRAGYRYAVTTEEGSNRGVPLLELRRYAIKGVSFFHPLRFIRTMRRVLLAHA